MFILNLPFDNRHNWPGELAFEREIRAKLPVFWQIIKIVTYY